ncbi:effector-associated constant component EACC1 [Nocardia aurantia]|uniref:effector-associated constant component EACC1 n=1 Tax=Nocardia aurantia TaxID=2585199 RepID=UPI0029E7D050|nr:hypothetical protein [Nocardia aurantia]
MTSGNSSDLHTLRSRLAAEETLRGRVRLISKVPPVGTLGSAIETVTVALRSDGAAMALAGALVAWIRTQPGDLTVNVSRSDGTTVELSAERARLDDENTRSLLTDLLAGSVDAHDTRTGQG